MWLFIIYFSVHFSLLCNLQSHSDLRKVINIQFIALFCKLKLFPSHTPSHLHPGNGPVHIVGLVNESKSGDIGAHTSTSKFVPELLLWYKCMYTVSYLNPAMDFDMDSDEDEDDDGEEAESLAEKTKEIMHSKVATVICLVLYILLSSIVHITWLYYMIVVSLVIV